MFDEGRDLFFGMLYGAFQLVLGIATVVVLFRALGEFCADFMNAFFDMIYGKDRYEKHLEKAIEEMKGEQ
jgi:hypothetical protein